MSELSSLPFFQRFSKPLREAMIEGGSVKGFHKGEQLFAPGDVDTDFYMLIRGRVQTFKLSKGGQKRILRTVQPGDSFAMVSLFDDRPMYITAEVLGEEAEVFVLPRQTFMDLLDQYSELARFVIEGLVRRLRRYGEAYTAMTVYSVDQRFISLLLELADRADTQEVHLPDSITTLAEQLGTAREVLSREISKMSRKGWLSKKGSVVSIKNRKALQKRLEEA